MPARPLTDHEEEAVQAIRAWKAQKPGLWAKVMGVLGEPITWVVRQKAVERVLATALDGANSLAHHLADADDVRREAGVKDIAELRSLDLALSDRMADRVHNWAIGLAASEGTATGLGGLFALPADVPFILTLALRTIHKIGLCYGYEATSPGDKDLVLGVLGASGALDLVDKVAALASLRSVQVTVASQTWKQIAATASKDALSGEATLVAATKVARALGWNLTAGTFQKAIPFLGAALGGAANARYVRGVGWAARRTFQELWLIANGKGAEI
ncbi:MAG TPA: EcsC family protein [Anaeromyxobacteraceae bacterium]|nr:EcsC family protein [Anaeromyxobacteraceae bacterium]